MREIKFRAWDNDKQRYSRQDEQSFLVENNENESYNVASVSFGCELEQYTGLHDKNGKEIYEGDIVICSGGCPHQVIWVEEIGGTFIGGMPAWYLSGLRDGYAWTGTERLIGNIHENPVLLEGK